MFKYKAKLVDAISHLFTVHVMLTIPIVFNNDDICFESRKVAMKQFPAKNMEVAASLAYPFCLSCQEGFSGARRPFALHIWKKNDFGGGFVVNIFNAFKPLLGSSASNPLQQACLQNIFDWQNDKLFEIIWALYIGAFFLETVLKNSSCEKELKANVIQKRFKNDRSPWCHSRSWKCSELLH